MQGVILSVCIISCAMGIVENLTDGTKLGKQLSFLLSLILLSVIFMPFAEGDSLPDFDEYTTINMSEEYSTELYNNQLKKQVSDNVTAVLGLELQKNGVEYEFLETEVNISETNCIFISKVTVGTNNFERAEKIIKENLGEETEVLNESG